MISFVKLEMEGRKMYCDKCGQIKVRLTDGTYDCGCITQPDYDAMSTETEDYPSLDTD